MTELVSHEAGMCLSPETSLIPTALHSAYPGGWSILTARVSCFQETTYWIVLKEQLLIDFFLFESIVVIILFSQGSNCLFLCFRNPLSPPRQTLVLHTSSLGELSVPLTGSYPHTAGYSVGRLWSSCLRDEGSVQCPWTSFSCQTNFLSMLTNWGDLILPILDSRLEKCFWNFEVAGAVCSISTGSRAWQALGLEYALPRSSSVRTESQEWRWNRGWGVLFWRYLQPETYKTSQITG